MWFPCPGCDRMVTSLVLGSGPKNEEAYSRTHCCHQCQRGEGHHPDWYCAAVPRPLFREVKLSKEGSVAHCLVHVPPGAHMAPAVLFLHGAVTYVYPESLWFDIRALVDKNEVVRNGFVVVAPFASVGEPLAAVSTSRVKTDRYGNSGPYADDFQWDLVWEAFLRICSDLGPNVVDLARLHAVGYSMGGQAVWRLAMERGSELAAAVPFAAKCAWPEDSWSREQGILEMLRSVAIRSYVGKGDTGSYRWSDFKWLAGRLDLSDLAESRQRHSDTEYAEVYGFGDRLQLCLVVGTRSDHCCWDIVLHNEASFGLFSWLAQLRCHGKSQQANNACPT